jgi:hypothetical protein
MSSSSAFCQRRDVVAKLGCRFIMAWDPWLGAPRFTTTPDHLKGRYESSVYRILVIATE